MIDLLPSVVGISWGVGMSDVGLFLAAVYWGIFWYCIGCCMGGRHE